MDSKRLDISNDFVSNLVENERRHCAAGGKRDAKLLDVLANKLAESPRLLDEVIFRSQWLRYRAAQGLRRVSLPEFDGELKFQHIAPCPFCGGRGRLKRVLRVGCRVEDQDGWAHFIRCDSCAAHGGGSKGPRDGRIHGRAGAVTQWNMRRLP